VCVSEHLLEFYVRGNGLVFSVGEALSITAVFSLNVYYVLPPAVPLMELQEMIVGSIGLVAEIKKDRRIKGSAIGNKDVDALFQFRSVGLRMIEWLHDCSVEYLVVFYIIVAVSSA
jgi:hypothetical protein